MQTKPAYVDSNVLVTGGTGFIGSHLVERLVAERARVTVLDNLGRGSLRNLAAVQPQIRFIQGDIRNRGCLLAAMRDQTFVFHLAAQSSVLGASADLDESFTSNVVGTFEVLRAAKSMGVPHLIFASSREVYGDPQCVPVSEDACLRPKNPYGVSKLAGELYCKAFENDSFRVSILRLANVYGLRDAGRVIPLFVEQSLRNEDLVLYGGGQILDFVWIDSVVDAFLRAGSSVAPFGILNVGSGKGVAIRDLASQIVTLSNSRSRIRFEQPRSIESVRFIADTTRARETLGLDFSQEPLHKLRLLLHSANQPAPAHSHA